MSPENSKYPMVSQYGNTISRKLKLLKDLHPYGVSLIYPSSKTLTYKIHRKREKQKHQPWEWSTFQNILRIRHHWVLISQFQQGTVQYWQLCLNYAWKKSDHSERGELHASNLMWPVKATASFISKLLTYALCLMI